MENAKKIEIMFKSGDTFTYDKDQWDEYDFDGNVVIVKKKGAVIGIYNFYHIFGVELKE